MTAFLFTAAALSNAFLLFLVEPLVGKMILPVLGGAPAVWNSVILFFQTALVAGYLYAHVGRRWPQRTQVLVHAVLVTAAGLLLPVHVPAGWAAPGVELPVAWVFALVGVMAGGPFVVVSSASPLIQRWFSTTDDPHAHDPYFLYAATNTGSLAGLLAFPILLEPALRLSQQAWLWSVGYVAVGGLTVWTGAWALGRASASPAGSPARTEGSAAEPAARESWRQRGRWLRLAFVPSSLMLGVTAHITTDIAAFPLVLVVPLALYLVTFILAFARRQIVPWRAFDAVFPLAALPVAFTFALSPTGPLWLLVPLHLVCFFVLALGCHHWLAESRPEAGRLTSYYLWVALGGALGGVFNGILAPMLFDSMLEYPIVVAMACFLRPTPAAARPGRLRLAGDVAVAALLGASLWPLQLLLARFGPFDPAMSDHVGVGLVLVAASLAAAAPRRFAFIVAGLLVAVQTQAVLTQPALFSGRSYFGVLRVTADAQGTRELIHGSTIHGTQLRDGRRNLVPAAYYHPDGPAGDIMRAAGPRVAIVGLGTGALACYAGAGQQWVFFEIDPLVERIARDPRLFTYLQGCLPDARIVIGDARVRLEGVPDGSYSTLVIDAFNSDAIPVHLLTEEAVRLYVRKLAAGGRVALHVSNRHLALEPVLGRIATDLGLAGRAKSDDGDEAEHLGSNWVVIARRDEDLDGLGDRTGWVPLRVDGAPRWTDDFANVLGAMQWSRPGS